MAVDTKLEEKKFGIHMSGLTKVLPWLYPAFAVVFLGLNIAGITTGLGSGILGNLPQGAILNGNIWQSIANGAYLLAQGTLVGAGVVAIPALYSSIRNITSYARYKKAEKFNFVKNKKVAGVNYDKEAQKTESIINAMLPSATIGSSRLEQALKLRADADMAKGLKKLRLNRKAIWQEDVIRRSIVKLTDRLAELTKMENRNWKTNSSKSGYITLTTNEIETRKTEMRMIQDYLFTVLNKVEKNDPFFTTLLAQVKKYRVDQLNNGTKLAGIHLVQETSSPDAIATANAVNDALVKGDIKKALVSLYNEAENDLTTVATPPTDAVKRAIANISLQRAEDAASLAESAADSATQDAYTAYLKSNEINTLLDQLKLTSRAKLDDIDEIKNNAGIILNTLVRTFKNASKKKQGINKAYNQAKNDLVALGVTKDSAEAICKQIQNKNTEADTILAQMHTDETNASTILGNIEDLKREATDILSKMGRQRTQAKNILRKLNANIVASNGNLATIRRLVSSAYTELGTIISNKNESATLVAAIADQQGVARDIIEQILEESQRATDNANEAERQLNKATSYADNARTEHDRAKDFADKTGDIYSNILQISNDLTSVLTNATSTLADIEQAKEYALAKLADIKIYGQKAEGIINTIVKNAEKVRELKNDTQSNADKSKKAKNDAKKSAEQAKESAKLAQQYEEETKNVLSSIKKFQTEIKRIKQSVKDIRTSIKDKSKSASEIIAELQSSKADLQFVIADITGLHLTATSETEGIADLANSVRSDAYTLLAGINRQLENAMKSAQQTKSYEQSAQQIRIRMTQLENSSRQILTNIRKLYIDLKTEKKVSTEEIANAKNTLTQEIESLRNLIAETEKDATLSTDTLKTQLVEATNLLNNITIAEKEAKESSKQAKESADEIKEIARKFLAKYNKFVDDYNASFAGYNTLTERLEDIETRLKNGENVAKELSSLETTVATLREELDKLIRNRVTRYQIEKLKKSLKEEAVDKIVEINANIKNINNTIINITTRLDGLKVIKPQSPEKIQLNKTLKEIKDWARIICWATATSQPAMKKSSLGGATRFVKSKISGPSKKTNSALTYSEDQIIGKALNEFLGSNFEDISKINNLEEAQKLLASIVAKVESYNNNYYDSSNSGKNV